ncbi:MAG: patatin-like phospholipase family protein [Ignavibacteriaceae bacterium]|nr:patatin-like phospholipase family protein [Ignavibacteriaceae bacterium]MCW8813034.1 patatin-like phospholipase family protein [Chlorobium sp.]
MNLFKKILVAFFLLHGSHISAQGKILIPLKTKTVKLPYGLEQKIPASEPIIGLSLSGGGARGLAQIGIIKALEEAGIKVSAIAGTSIGSIIGGAYASGYSVKEMDSIVINTDWNRLLSINNTSERRELFVDQKISEDRSLFTLRLNGFSPVIPTSFNEGLRLSNYLTLLCLDAPVIPGKSFDDLLIKYRAVCTNLVNGKQIVLSHGSLARAMRASSSVTFLLSPVTIDSLILVDGGLVSNIPVSAVLEMGVDYVIAANTTSKLRSEDDLELPWNVADQTVSIPMKKLEKIELSKANIVLEPQIEKWSSTDFTNIDSLIMAGYNYTKRIVPKIKSQLDSLVVKKFSVKEFWVRNVKFDRNSEEYVFPYLTKYQSMDSVSSFELYNDMLKLYNTGRYDSLNVSLKTDDDSTEIKFEYTLKPQIKSVEILSDVTTDTLQNNLLLSSLTGKPFDGKIIFDAVRKLITLYKKKGFVLYTLHRYHFNQETGKLTLEFRAGTISGININSETSETVIEREFNIKAGDRLLYSDIEEGLQNLRATGLFEEILLVVEPIKSGATIDLFVKERISSLLKLGFLVDNTYNAQMGIDLRDVNIWGSGTELGLFLFGGASNRAYILEHIAYRILDSYFTYKLSAYYKFNDINVYNIEVSETGNTFTSNKIGRYRQIFYGASLSLGTQLEKFGKMIFTGKYQFDEVKNKEGEVKTPYKTKILGLKISAIVDNQNIYPYPEDGLYFNGFYETAQSFLGSGEGYLLVSADLKYYYKFAAQHVVSPRVQVGFGDKTLPLSEQFTMGGLYSFFGAYENEFRGRQIFLTSLLYQYKLPFKIFFDTYAWFRYDLGTTWDVQEQIRFKDLRHGIGGAISFDTPIGPADFSIGRSFIISQGLTENSFVWGDVIFYFSIGHAVSF